MTRTGLINPFGCARSKIESTLFSQKNLLQRSFGYALVDFFAAASRIQFLPLARFKIIYETSSTLKPLRPLSGIACAVIFFLSTSSFALDHIIRPYQGARSSAMGGTRITTGLYDDNFFGNPGRVTANPKFRFTILDPMVEVNSNLNDTLDLVKKISSSGSDIYNEVGKSTGKNSHLRIQTTMPSIYLPTNEAKLAWAFGVISSTQLDVDLRPSYSLAPQALSDFGPALTVGRKFMEKDELSVGVTAHATYRVATQQFEFVDIIRGSSLGNLLNPGKSGAGGLSIDFDTGATYALPITYWGFDFTTGAALNNIFGGRYTKAKFRNTSPPSQGRSLSMGVGAHYPVWQGLTDTLIAFEMTDIGNNPDGGMTRLIHIGAETHYGVLVPRLGINQGYLCAGLGLNLKYFTLDLTTYGEEMALNPGELEDRRFAAKMAFQVVF